jgi:hypothetical protein
VTVAARQTLRPGRRHEMELKTVDRNRLRRTRLSEKAAFQTQPTKV